MQFKCSFVQQFPCSSILKMFLKRAQILKSKVFTQSKSGKYVFSETGFEPAPHHLALLNKQTNQIRFDREIIPQFVTMTFCLLFFRINAFSDNLLQKGTARVWNILPGQVGDQTNVCSCEEASGGIVHWVHNRLDHSHQARTTSP